MTAKSLIALEIAMIIFLFGFVSNRFLSECNGMMAAATRMVSVTCLFVEFFLNLHGEMKIAGHSRLEDN
jgi:hypothetical protein